MKNKKVIFSAILLGCLSCHVSYVHPRSLFTKITKPLRTAKRSVQGLKNSVFSSNFHKVHDGLYRSSQPSAKQLCRYIHRNNIRTIINLRGENRGTKWWQNEYRVANNHRVTLVNIPLNSKQPLSRNHLKQILKAYDEGRKKGAVLIHCQSGADRTGAVATILEYNRTRNERIAFRQLSLKYGHSKVRKPNMRRSVNRWINAMKRAQWNRNKALALY